MTAFAHLIPPPEPTMRDMLSETAFALHDALELLEEHLPADHAALCKMQDALCRANVRLLEMDMGRGR